jgi:N-acetylmuramoyl-L-alanine amidase
VDFVVPTGARPAFFVEEGQRELTLTLYDTQLNTDLIHYGENDSLVRMAQWTPDASDRGHFTLRLASAPYGYLVMWDKDHNSLVLRVRRPPVVDPSSPLKGMVIAVDPGHPPIGATGPTGLYEPVPTLAIGMEVKRLLEADGATVYMTRTTADPVGLNDRPVMIRRSNANAAVSIHLNALPDGVNPFISNGTGAYYFWPQSIPLARELQLGMVSRMGLKNLGINYDNLALARPTWMPAVLCEGAFLMLPDQESALRTPEFQTAYARGVVDGLERYFRSLATAK